MSIQDDINTTVTALRDKDVWDEYIDYPRGEWKYEVAEGNTNLGYWDWVLQQVDVLHG